MSAGAQTTWADVYTSAFGRRHPLRDRRPRLRDWAGLLVIVPIILIVGVRWDSWPGVLAGAIPWTLGAVRLCLEEYHGRRQSRTGLPPADPTDGAGDGDGARGEPVPWRR